MRQSKNSDFMKIVIVDYGSGNLRSVQKGFDKIGFSAEISNNPQAISDATHVVVPGVGAFPECMKRLDHLNLLRPIESAIRAGKPYLGICLGLQILFTEGEEFGSTSGLNLIYGKVVRFPHGSLKVPHIGWNQVQSDRSISIMEGIPNNSYFYFVHSYYGLPTEPDCIVATTEYGTLFPAAIARDNIFACQFHPEKSQEMGLRLLSNFAKWKG